MSITRRGFITSGVAASVAGLCLASPAFASEAKSTSDSTDGDVIVVGAGFGGMVAASLAAEAGLNVIVLEASTRVGGTGLLCSGTLGFGGKEITVDTLKADCPLGDYDMFEAYATGWAGLSEWINASGAPIEFADGNFKFSPESGSPAGNVAVADWFAEHIASVGGQILLQTRATKLIVDQDGAVTGVEVVDASGMKSTYSAKKVILACGGFMGDKAIMEAYMGSFADRLQTRGNPYNNGSGMRMGLAAGAALSTGLSTFYGYHLPDAGIIVKSREEWDTNVTDTDWLALQQSMMSNIQGYSGFGIVVNQQGVRFENEAQRDNAICNGTIHQKYARSFIILDDAIRQNSVGMASTGIEKIDVLVQNGADVIQADTIDALADALATGYGVYKANLIATIEGYNTACDAGTAGDLPVPKTNPDKCTSLATPPFYAIPATPGVSLCYGGLRADTVSRVLNADDEPIANLYALPGVAGGIAYWDSVGVLASICSFAYLAAGDIVSALV